MNNSMHFFWSGKFTDFQLASILSFKNNGFDVTLWTLDDIDLSRYNIPVKNANEVLVFDKNKRYTNYHTGKDVNDFYSQISLYCDFFRCHLQLNHLVNYSDLDVLCLKHYNEWKSELAAYNLGLAYGQGNLVNSAIIVNLNHSYTKSLYEALLQRYDSSKSVFDWACFGPLVFTDFVKQHNIPLPDKDLFYPILIDEWKRAFSNNINDISYCEEKTANSLCYHWWNDAVDHFGIDDTSNSFLDVRINSILKEALKNETI